MIWIEYCKKLLDKAVCFMFGSFSLQEINIATCDSRYVKKFNFVIHIFEN